jgi:hypothetical protein
MKEGDAGFFGFIEVTGGDGGKGSSPVESSGMRAPPVDRKVDTLFDPSGGLAYLSLVSLNSG